MPNPGGLPIIPHQNVGADCCGCLVPEIRGESVDLVCNEYSVTVRTISRSDFDAGRLPEELLSMEIYSARCPHCSAIQMFPGFSVIEALVCSECGEGVVIQNRA